MQLADLIKLSTYGLLRSGAKICRPVLCDREKAVQLATREATCTYSFVYVLVYMRLLSITVHLSGCFTYLAMVRSH